MCGESAEQLWKSYALVKQEDESFKLFCVCKRRIFYQLMEVAKGHSSKEDLLMKLCPAKDV